MFGESSKDMGIKYIAITQRIDIIESYNEIRDCLDIKWAELIMKCGFLPYILPNNLEIVKLMLENKECIQGILLTGGNDLYKYNGNAQRRDIVEYYLIEYAIKNNMPLLGICRGMQIIQDYYKVKLYKISGHVGTKHDIIYNNNLYKLNSYHNYGTTQNNENLHVIMRSEDGIIEVIRHKKYNIYGTMHHPERINPFDINDIELIKKVMKVRK